jgi:hypothetical protein
MTGELRGTTSKNCLLYSDWERLEYCSHLRDWDGELGGYASWHSGVTLICMAWGNKSLESAEYKLDRQFEQRRARAAITTFKPVVEASNHLSLRISTLPVSSEKCGHVQNFRWGRMSMGFGRMLCPWPISFSPLLRSC